MRVRSRLFLLFLVSLVLQVAHAPVRAGQVSPPQTSSTDATVTLRTARMLLERGEISAGLAAFSQLIEQDPANLKATLQGLRDSALAIRRYGARDHTEECRQLAANVRARLATLPRESAARLHMDLLGFENAAGIANWQERRAALMREFAGTSAQLEWQVDDVGGQPLAPLSGRLARFDAFVKEHPGTTAAAKARFRQVCDLSANGSGLGTDISPKGADPTDRLLRTLDILADLNTGPYPASEWPKEALRCFLTFSTFGQRYTPDNVDRALDGYRRFVMSNYPASDEGPLESSIDYVITTRYAEVAAARGQDARFPAVDALLDELERTPERASRVRYLRATFYLMPADGDRPSNRDRFEPKAREILAGIADTGRGDFPRAAVQRLAEMDFRVQRDTDARTWLVRYLDRYGESDWAWIANIRLGQTYEATGATDTAIDAYRKTAARAKGNALARVVSHVYAARLLEGQSRLVDARHEYQQALDAWSPDVGDRARLPLDRWNVAGATAVASSIAATAQDASKPAVQGRLKDLDRVISIPGGPLLEQGRYLLARSRYDEARSALSRLLADYPRSPAAAEAKTMAHRATLEAALAIPTDSAADLARMRRALDELAPEPVDPPVLVGQIAIACLELGQGRAAEAERRMREALDRWEALRPPRPVASLTPLERDVMAIRDVVFRPLGGGIYGSNGWNAFDWPKAVPPFVVMSPEVHVRAPGVDDVIVPMPMTFTQAGRVLFVNGDEFTLLMRVMNRIGGTLKRQPAAVMETPNQPIGPSLDILDLWKKFFDARPGHWGGWEIYTYPASGSVEFLDAERTKAQVPVSIGYSGATVVLEKVDGVWKAVKLTNQWVT